MVAILQKFVDTYVTLLAKWEMLKMMKFTIFRSRNYNLEGLCFPHLGCS